MSLLIATLVATLSFAASAIEWPLGVGGYSALAPVACRKALAQLKADPHAPFFKAIAETPVEDSPRQVYADWLEEKGDPRAEFVRVQLRIAALEKQNPLSQELLALKVRERALLEANASTWIPKEIKGLAEGVGFERGVIEKVTAYGRHVQALLARLPTVESVDLLYPVQPPDRLWLRSRYATQVRSLQGRFLERDAISAVLESPRLKNLRKLSLQWSQLPVDLVLVLFTSSPIRELTHLELIGASLSTESVQTISSSPRSQTLTHLNLTANNLSGASLTAIASSPYLKNLTHLNVSHHQFGTEDVVTFAQSENTRKLKSLSIGFGPISPRGLAALLESPSLQNLISLDLSASFHPRGDVLALQLADSPRLSQLLSLNLEDNGIGPEGIKALVGTARVSQLRSLRLSANPIGSQGIAAIAHSPYLKNLKILDLRQVAVSHKDWKRLRQSPYLKNTRILW